MRKLFIMAGTMAVMAVSCGKKETTNDSAMGVPGDSVVNPADNTETAVDTTSAEAQAVQADVEVTVDGKVVSVTQGKDGQTAEIQDDAGKKYFATISIPNLNDPKRYRQVKPGDRIEIKGESFKLDDGLHIKVTEIKE